MCRECLCRVRSRRPAYSPNTVRLDLHGFSREPLRGWRQVAFDNEWLSGAAMVARRGLLDAERNRHCWLGFWLATITTSDFSHNSVNETATSSTSRATSPSAAPARLFRASALLQPRLGYILLQLHLASATITAFDYCFNLASPRCLIIPVVRRLRLYNSLTRSS